MGSNSFLSLLFWIGPAAVGLVLAFAKPSEAIAWVNRASEWWERRYQAAKAKGGLIVGGVWRALIWGFHKVHGLTAGMGDDAQRAGVRAAFFFYIGALSLFLVASVIYLALALALVVVGFWLLGKFLGSENSGNRNVDMLRSSPAQGRKHGRVVDGPRRQSCGCKHACPTSAVITEYSCGCREVEILNDRFAGSDCSDFSGMRRSCGARGAPG